MVLRTAIYLAEKRNSVQPTKKEKENPNKQIIASVKYEYEHIDFT